MKKAQYATEQHHIAVYRRQGRFAEGHMPEPLKASPLSRTPNGYWSISKPCPCLQFGRQRVKVQESVKQMATHWPAGCAWFPSPASQWSRTAPMLGQHLGDRLRHSSGQAPG